MTKLDKNLAELDAAIALAEEESEWRILKSISTDSLIDMILERDLNNDQWAALMEKVGASI